METSPENEAPEAKIDRLEKEVAELKNAMDMLTKSMYDFTRMLFKSGGRGLDEYPKRDEIFALEATMNKIRHALGQQLLFESIYLPKKDK